MIIKQLTVVGIVQILLFSFNICRLHHLGVSDKYVVQILNKSAFIPLRNSRNIQGCTSSLSGKTPPMHE